jgi:hypothetical protein
MPTSALCSTPPACLLRFGIRARQVYWFFTGSTRTPEGLDELRSLQLARCVLRPTSFYRCRHHRLHIGAGDLLPAEPGLGEVAGIP